MSQPTVAQYLEFAHLQMAAEAFYGLMDTKPDWQIGESKHLQFSNLLDDTDGTRRLVAGNDHASKFPTVLTEQFTANWEMVAHISNTGSGFSGSLFRAEKDIPGTDIKEGELTLSFRSTEFIEDAVRDNRATNTFEIKEKGFAFSQMADMEQWVQLLVDKGLIGADKPVNVTGYSLGAHLATAFNLLHQGDGLIKATYTFNGAGVGKGADGHPIRPEDLQQALAWFRELKAGATEAEYQDRIVVQLHAGGEVAVDLAPVYAKVRTLLDPSLWRIADTPMGKADDLSAYQAKIAEAEKYLDQELAVIHTLTREDGTLKNGTAYQKLVQLEEAVMRVREIANEYQRVQGIKSGDGQAPNPYPARHIDALGFEHQLSVVMTADRYTKAYSIAEGAANIAMDYEDHSLRVPENTIPDFYNIWAATKPSMVAVSQLHYGAHNVLVGIEDQPLVRGDYLSLVAGQTVAELDGAAEIADLQLLVPGYKYSAFGDTHSLVLIVDSLSVQKLLQTLDSALDVDSLRAILALGSNVEAKADLDAAAMTKLAAYWHVSTGILAELLLNKTDAKNKQGDAEGDVLENLLNKLADSLGMVLETTLKGDLNGGTWHELGGADETSAYTGREKLHQVIDRIAKLIKDHQLADQFAIKPATQASADLAKTDFGHLLALEKLSPFVLEAKTAGAMDAFWQQAFPEAFQNWQADMAAQKNGEAGLHYTEQWLADRQLLLTVKAALDRSNTAYDTEEIDMRSVTNRDERELNGNLEQYPELKAFQYQGVRVVADDLAVAGQKAALNLTLLGQNSNGTVVHFGGALEDVLSGGKLGDRLYGGAGADTLDGGEGNDYLEGGIGADTYLVRGRDIVFDSDGQGKIVFTGRDRLLGEDSQNLQAGVFVRDSWNADYWYSVGADGKPDDELFAQRNGNDLHVNRDGADLVVIKDFFVHAAHTGDGGRSMLGIMLQEEAAPPPEPDAGLIAYSGNDGLYNIFNLSGDKGFLIYGGSKDDTVFGGTAPSEFYTGDGNDRVFGSFGADKIYGGEGFDVLNGSVYVGAGAGVVRTPEEQARDKDLIVGGNGRDLISGMAGDDIIHTGLEGEYLLKVGGEEEGDWAAGGLGDDRIFGSANHDFLSGGEGTDQLYGGAGRDVLIGDGFYRAGTGNQYISVPDAVMAIHHTYQGGTWEIGEFSTAYRTRSDTDNWRVVIDEQRGDYTLTSAIKPLNSDHLVAQDGARDYLYGGSGDDLLIGQDGDDFLKGEDGDDILWGDDNRDPGIAGNDYLNGGSGNDTLYGGKGKDTLLAGSGDKDVLNGGEGDDIYWLEAADLIGENGSKPQKRIEDSDGQGSVLIDGILLQNARWQAVAGDSPRWQAADRGWTLVLEGSQLVLSGTNFAGSVIIQDYRPGMLGLALPVWPPVQPEPPVPDQPEQPLPPAGDARPDVRGDDTDNTLHGSDADEALHGFGGNDELYSGGGSNYVHGGAGDDRLYGGAGNNLLFGGSGRDVLAGGSGDDQLDGGDGDDTLNGGAGNDRLEGKAGDDVLYGEDGRDLMWGNEGDDTLHGGAGDDQLDGGEGRDILLGGEGADRLQGRADDDTMDGEAGNDLLWGDAGHDVLHGGAGDDQLDGGEGNDRLNGGAGIDRLWGGEGADVFVFDRLPSAGEADLVLDFAVGSDRIALSQLVFDGLGGTLSASAFGAGSVAASSEERMLFDAGNGHLYYDADGNGAGAAVHIATLSGSGLAQLDHNSFQLV